MARMIPNRPVEGAPDSELIVFDALQGLGEDWTVFHSVRWQAIRGHRQGDGEADFVLLHDRHGLLVLEVKGGGIEIVDGIWTTTNRFGQTAQIKNPFEQAVASKHALLQYIRYTLVGGDRIPVTHAVVFPDIEVRTPLGLDAPLVLTIDAKRLKDISRAVGGIVAHWGASTALPRETIDQLVSKLRPTLQIRRVLRDDIGAIHERLLHLTAQQIRVLGGLRLNRRARIVGGAGTGKTVLAVEKAREYAAEGRRTLLTCFNEPLADLLAKALDGDPNVVVLTFHSLCLHTMRKAGMRIPSELTDGWWESESATLLAEAATTCDVRFDAVVVDEGQDFRRDWIDALLICLSSPDESPFYVFMDSHQDLYARDCAYPTHWPAYELTINCRNTLPIATRVASVFQERVDSIGTSGPEPKVVFVRSNSEILASIEDIAHDLLEREQLSPADLMVLCGSRALVDSLRSMTIGDRVFCQPGRRGIPTETIWRFKGLESSVVLLALPELAGVAGNVERELAYIGLSRAQAALFVVAHRSWKQILT